MSVNFYAERQKVERERWQRAYDSLMKATHEARMDSGDGYAALEGTTLRIGKHDFFERHWPDDRHNRRYSYDSLDADDLLRLCQPGVWLPNAPLPALAQLARVAE